MGGLVVRPLFFGIIANENKKLDQSKAAYSLNISECLRWIKD
jgi:hypothetical protein